MVDNYRPFRLINICSGYFVHQDDDKSNLRMERTPNDKAQLFYAECIQDGWIFRNLRNGYYIHCDEGGKANIRQHYDFDDESQILYFDNSTGQLKNKYSGYFVHADGAGGGNVRMNFRSNDKSQTFRLEYDAGYPSVDNDRIEFLVKNTQELDDYLTNQDSKNRYCGISDKSWSDLDGQNTRIKPIFSYLKYVSETNIQSNSEQEYTFEKINGTVKTWNVSTEITQSISAKLEVIEQNTSIKLGFSYTSQISEQTKEEWKQKVTGPVTCWNFQPIIVFALETIKGDSENPSGTKLIHLARNRPFLTTEYKKGVEPMEADIIIGRNKEKWNIDSIILLRD